MLKKNIYLAQKMLLCMRLIIILLLRRYLNNDAQTAAGHKSSKKTYADTLAAKLLAFAVFRTQQSCPPHISH
jgi:hypothetical protein